MGYTESLEMCETDRKGQKLTEADRIGQRGIETDRNSQVSGFRCQVLGGGYTNTRPGFDHVT